MPNKLWYFVTFDLAIIFNVHGSITTILYFVINIFLGRKQLSRDIVILLYVYIVSIYNLYRAKLESAKRDSAKRYSAKRDSAKRDSAKRDSYM